MDELNQDGTVAARLEQLAEESGCPVFKITGELDVSNVGSIRSAIEATVGRGIDRIVFDLSALDFMDSSGLAMLLAMTGRAGRVEIRDPQPLIRRVIELTGLSGTFVVTP